MAIIITILAILFFLGTLLFWALMLIDCAQRKFITYQDKIMWLVVIFLFPIIGALFYYFGVKKKA